jgi:predicted enzyme related to lactoylglutathione lyase
MPRPVYFEIPAADPARAMAFYETAFGWKFTKWEGSPMAYWLISTGEGPGIDGGVNTLEVPDLDAALATVAAQGGSCVVPKMPVPGVGWLAYCKDTEGHIFGMMQRDAGAVGSSLPDGSDPVK